MASAMGLGIALFVLTAGLTGVGQEAVIWLVRGFGSAAGTVI